MKQQTNITTILTTTQCLVFLGALLSPLNTDFVAVHAFQTSDNSAATRKFVAPKPSFIAKSPKSTEKGMQWEVSQAKKGFGAQLWENLSQKAKDDVKSWFVERGNKKGVPFSESIDYFRAQKRALSENFQMLNNPTLQYDDYYTQTFHGYETGNLGWDAAEDCLPATLSMSLSYWPGTKPTDTEAWLRGNYTTALGEYLDTYSPEIKHPKILDVRGSVGVCTKALLDAFPESKVCLLDLSPHFLSSAKMFLETPGSPLHQASASERVSYHHNYAEMAPFPDKSFDAISISFVMHELPRNTAEDIVRESTRLLKHGGVLTILDLDPTTIMNLPPLRRFLFEISEPHVQDFTKKTDVLGLLEDAGLQHTVYKKNDPMNAHWMGRKPDRSWD